MHAEPPTLPVSVAWHPSARDADDALHEQVAGLLGTTRSAVRTGRLCASCGSDRHGRPWASGGVHVSLARSGPHLVTAVSTRGRVGVDVESVDDVARTWDPALVLHPTEVAETTADRAVVWCRKEAILKLAGTGLATPMAEVRVADHKVVDLTAPAGFRAAVAFDPSDDG